MVFRWFCGQATIGFNGCPPWHWSNDGMVAYQYLSLSAKKPRPILTINLAGCTNNNEKAQSYKIDSHNCFSSPFVCQFSSKRIFKCLKKQDDGDQVLA